jgi:hypothetical protein
VALAISAPADEAVPPRQMQQNKTTAATDITATLLKEMVKFICARVFAL